MLAVHAHEPKGHAHHVLDTATSSIRRRLHKGTGKGYRDARRRLHKGKLHGGRRDGARGAIERRLLPRVQRRRLGARVAGTEGAVEEVAVAVGNLDLLPPVLLE